MMKLHDEVAENLHEVEVVERESDCDNSKLW